MHNITTALLAEHAVFYLLADRVESAIASDAPFQVLKTYADCIRTLIIPHAATEEKSLFPVLEAEIGPQGPLSVMLHEHQIIDKLVDDLGAASEADKLAMILRQLIEIARSHFAKEEQVLFALANGRISPEVLHELAVQWASDRGVAFGSTDNMSCGG